jgi:hypothetical protein
LNWIGFEIESHNGTLGYGVRGTDGGRPGGKKDIDLLSNDLSCESWQSKWIPLCDAGHQLYAVSFNIAHSFQKLIDAECQKQT